MSINNLNTENNEPIKDLDITMDTKINNKKSLNSEIREYIKRTQSELVIIAKTETLFLSFYPRFRKFPKSEIDVISRDIRKKFLSLIETLELSSKIKSKRLYYANLSEGYLVNLKTLLRLSLNQHYVSLGLYKVVSKELTEITLMLNKYIKEHLQISKNKKLKKTI